MKKRLAAGFLILCIALALLPGAALAVPGLGEEDPIPVTEEGAPGEAPGEDPEETPGEVPEEAPGEVPEEAPGEVPGEVPGEIPEEAPGEIPGEAPGEVPEEIPGESDPDDPVPEFVPGVVEEDEEFFYPDYELLGSLLGEDLPASYDSRSVSQTPVKNQGSNGLCWAFGSCAALEAQLMVLNRGEQDLSELHMAYATSSRSGNGQQGFDREPHRGGNRNYASAYLMRGTDLSGAVDEESDPYITTRIGERELDLSRIREKTWQAQNILFLTGAGKDTAYFDLIKRAVQIYGGVGASIFWQGQTTATDGSTQQTFYNQENRAYCYNWDNDKGADKPDSSNSTNHAILIAGWDDSFPKENFNEIARPRNDGAWLIKNSWGKNWGDGGYAWVSYEDTSFPQYAFCFDGAEPYDPGEIVYETDYISNGSLGLGSATERYYAKVFSKETDGDEELTAVRIFLAGPYTSVQVGCVPQVLGETLDGYTFAPLGGDSAETFFPGWYTVKLDNPIRLTGAGGSRFAVSVRVTAPSQDEGGGGIWVGYDKQNSLNGAQMFYSGSGRSWSTNTSNYCIKAVTKPVDSQVRGEVIADKAARSLCWALIRGENEVQDNVRSKLNLPGRFKGAEISWTSSDGSIVQTDGTVSLARFDKKGEVTLTAAAARDGGGRTVTFQLTVPRREATGQDRFDAAKEWITESSARWWDLIRGDNTNIGEIRTDLVIPETVSVPTETGESFTIQLAREAGAREKNESGQQIPWRFVTDTGTVTRPAYGESDSRGLFFLRLSKGDGSYQSIVSWYLTVLAYRGALAAAPLADVTVPPEQGAVLRAEVSTRGAPGQLQYQWYQADDAGGTNPRMIPDAVSDQLRIISANTDGTGGAFFFCEISAPDAAPVRTNAARVTLIPGYPSAYVSGSDSRRVETAHMPLSAAASIYAARYDENGRMIGLMRTAGTEGNTAVFGSALDRGWKLFCLDGKNAPLCAAPAIG